MALKFFCDICNIEAKEFIRIDMGRGMYCKKCWLDRKNWLNIHKIAVKNSGF